MKPQNNYQADLYSKKENVKIKQIVFNDVYPSIWSI